MEFIFITAALLVGMVIGYFLAPSGSEQKALKHQHIWQITSSKPFREFAPGAKMGRDKSRVLRTCFCGDYKVDMVDGHWDMAELTATKV